MVELRDLLIEVVKVEGFCDAGHKVGDKIYIKGSNIIFEKSDKVCYWALSSLMPALFALQTGLEPSAVGLSKEKDIAYMACSDIGEPYTKGGRVIFKISILKE
ncbi:MAG: TIGR04076 family protein [Candidatus Heimdallarchaeaceae archaeon]